MKIETKFDLAQIVWYLYYWKYEWHPMETVIFEIKINDFGIQYNSAFEKDVFATKKEAEAECERRNKDEKTS